MKTNINKEEKFSYFREGFPALKEKIYLSICDKMILHDEVRNAVDLFLDRLASSSVLRIEHEELVIEAREKFATMMNVSLSTIATVKNVSDGINSIAWAMQWKRGDNIVVSIDAEHPNNIYPWLRMKRRGVEIRSIETLSDGSIDVGRMIESIDRNTRIMACASVSFAPGHRTDTETLGEACRAHDILFVVDGVQSAGILHHDLSAEPIDVFATSTSKGLLGIYGYGFLYVSEKWLDRLEPAYLSRSSVFHDNNDHSAMGAVEYKLQPDSRRFEVGSYNLAGAYAAASSLGLLLELDTCEIENHVLPLATTLHDGLSSAGLSCAVPRSGRLQSHIVTAGELDAGGHGFSNDPKIEFISRKLQETNIVHTIRRGQLRFAIHAFNTTEDIGVVVDTVRQAVCDIR